MTETKRQERRLGSARVSTYGQTLDTQLEQLRAAGCTTIYREKANGARAARCLEERPCQNKQKFFASFFKKEALACF